MMHMNVVKVTLVSTEKGFRTETHTFSGENCNAVILDNDTILVSGWVSSEGKGSTFFAANTWIQLDIYTLYKEDDKREDFYYGA